MIWSKIKLNYSDIAKGVPRFQGGKFQFKKKEKNCNVNNEPLLTLNRFLLTLILKRFCYWIMNYTLKNIYINTASKIYTIFIICIPRKKILYEWN